MNTNDGLSFAAAIDTSGYEKGIERMRVATESMGNVISHSIGDTASLSQKYAELAKVCDNYDRTMQMLSAEMAGYNKAAAEAFAAGDVKAFDAATAKIAGLEAQMQSTAEEARGYADALALVSQQMGIVAQTAKPPMFFTEDQLAAADALAQRLDSLNQQLAQTPDGSEAYASLQEQISVVTGQIDGMELAAAKAAAKLGTDLGGRAAEASARLHEVNSAMAMQNEACKNLEIQVAASARELQSLKDSMASPSEISAAQAAYDAYSQSLQNARMQMTALQGAQADAKAELAQVTSEVESHNSIMVKMLGGHERFTQVLSALPAPLQSAITGLNGMTGAAKAFIATPLGAVIAAITLAVQAMMSWFNSSVEGQLRFAEISGYVSGVLGQLKEIAISAGKALYNMFADPIGSAKQFLHFLASQVTNRVKAIGDMFGAIGSVISNVFTGNFADAKQSLKDMGNAYAEFVTGVENVTDKMSQWGKTVGNAASATAQISRATKELQMEASRWQAKETELNTKMTELYTKMMDSSLSKAQKKKYQQEYEDLVNLVSDQKVKLAQKAVDLQKQKMSLTTNSMEDEMQLDQLNNSLAQAQGYKAERMRMLQRMSNRINTAVADPQNAIDKADEQAQRQMERALQDAEMRAAQAAIDAKAEGEEKIQAQMKLNHQKEIQELERQKEDYLQKKIDTERAKFNADKSNKGKHFDSSAIKLTDEESEMFDNQMSDLLKKQKNESQEFTKLQQQAINEYLAQWGEYAQKRQAIIDIANEKLSKATTQGEKMSIMAQMKKDLAGLDMEATKTTNAISKLFGDMSNKSVKDLRKLASDGKKALDMLTDGKKYDEDLGSSLGITKEMWEVLGKDKDLLEKIRKAIKDIGKEADSIENPLNKIGKGFEDLFSAGDDKEKLKKALEEISEGLGELFQAVSVLSNAFGQLGDAIGSGALSGIADGLNAAMDAVNGAMSGAQAGVAFGPWGAAAGAAIGLVGSLGSSLAKLHDAKHEKKIQKIQEQIEALEKSYDTLGKSIEKAYSKDARKLIEDQNKLLEQQKLLLEQQIKEEESKKKTDNDRIKQWKSEIDEINELIEDNKEKAVDAIFGEDLKSAIENFASAYAEAWASGENRAKSAKDTVRNMMKQMVTASIESALQSSDAIKKIRDQLDEFYADNILTGWEQDYIYNMATELQKDLDRQFGWAESLLNDSKYEQSATAGGFQTMSEDTGTELNGRFTAMQITSERTLAEVEEINAGVSALRESAAELQNINLLQLAQLEGINANTKELFTISERLEKIERYTKDL